MGAQLEDEAQPAIKALGSLFKLTQVFLWDDAFVSTAPDAVSNLDSAAIASSSSSDEDEDMELTQQMNALGLPVSFKTNKRGSRTNQPKPKPKKKAIKVNPNSNRQQNKDAVLDREIAKCHQCSVCIIQSCVDQGSLPCDVGETERDLCSSAGNAVPDGFLDNQLVGTTVMVNPHGDAVPGEDITAAAESGVVSSTLTHHLLNNEYDTPPHGDYGDWRQFWDDSYMRNYFYNIKTHESTWELPSQLEYVSFSEGEPKLSDKIVGASGTDIILETPSVEVLGPCQNESYLESDAASVISRLTAFSEINTNPSVYTPSSTEQHINGQLSSEEDCTHSKAEEVDVSSTNQVSGSATLIATITDVSEESLDTFQLDAKDELGKQNPSLAKKKKKVTRTRRQSKPYGYSNIIPQEFPDGIVKYWCQRYSLFSLYDDGIKMDEEGWFSVTPEPIARHHAMRCGDGVVIDSFTGVGGNAIQLAKRGNHVIAVDIDPQKIEFAQHNATIYGVDGHIDFIAGDFFQLAPEMKADTIFLSPPWGGPDYVKVQTYNINTMLKPHDAYFLFNTSRRIASRVIMFLPRNVDLNQLAELSLSAEPPWMLEVERNFLNGKLKAITAYFTSTENVECSA